MDIISLDDLITSSGKYKDRAKSPELIQAKKNAGIELLKKVNALLQELGITHALVSSGFRTSASNANTKGAAAHSHHMDCRAIDLVDSDGKLDELFSKNIPVLIKHELYLESPKSTNGWSHLQDVPTHNNPFIP